MINPTMQQALDYAVHQVRIRQQIDSGAARDLSTKQAAELAKEQLGELDKRIVKQLNKGLGYK